MSELAKNIVKKLLDDDNFIKECKKDLDEIMKDKKFDVGDLPEVISLVTLVTTKYDAFVVDKNNIVEVFRLLIVELLKKLNLLEESNNEIDKMLEACLNLLVLKVKSRSLWSKLRSCFTTSSEVKQNPLNNKSILNNIRDDEIEILLSNDTSNASTDTGDLTDISTNIDVSGNDVSGNDVSGNDVSGNDVSGNDVSGNDVSGNDVSGNDVSGNDVSGNDVSGNDVSGNDVSGNDVSGNDVSGNDVSGN